MLTATTTQSMWQAIRRLERAVAEQDRRTPTGPAARSAASRASSTGRAAAELAAPSWPVPMASAAPIIVRPGTPGTPAGEWTTVFEAPAVDPSASPSATVTAYLRVRAELPAETTPDVPETARPGVRVLVGAAEVFSAAVDELAADADGYAVAGPLSLPTVATASGSASGTVPSVRVQVRGPDGAELTVWPPWLTWRS